MSDGVTPPPEDRNAVEGFAAATHADLGLTETSGKEGSAGDHAVAAPHGEVAAAGEDELGIDGITAAHALAETSNDVASVGVVDARPDDGGCGRDVTMVVDASQPGAVTIKIKGIGGRCG